MSDLAEQAISAEPAPITTRSTNEPASLTPETPTETGEGKTENSVEIKSLIKWYRVPRGNRGVFRQGGSRSLVLNRLTMTVPKGSVYGFVGQSGSGKSTAIRAMATLEKPDGGSIQIAGINAKSQPASVRKRVGYMPDSFGVYDGLTVREYLDFYGCCDRLPRRQRRRLTEELLELVELADHRDVVATSLSRGMRQRLGIARCLLHDPEILLLDDPASGMDPRARMELFEILRGLSTMNKTIVISSAVLPELADVCTDIGVVHQGVMVAEGPVHEVIERFAIQSQPQTSSDSESTVTGKLPPIDLEDVFFALTESKETAV